MNKGAKILINTLFIIYIAMVLFFCFYKFSSTGIDLGKYFLGIRLDRYAHFIMFFPYPFITWLTCRYSARWEFMRRHAILLTLVSGLIFAGMTEVFQDWFFASRQGDVLDYAAASLSIITGTVTVAFTGHPIVQSINSFFTDRKYDKI